MSRLKCMFFIFSGAFETVLSKLEELKKIFPEGKVKDDEICDKLAYLEC